MPRRLVIAGIGILTASALPACSSNNPAAPDAATTATIDATHATIDATTAHTIDAAIATPDAVVVHPDAATPDAAPQSNDPFDDNSCLGDPITYSQLIGLFPAGASATTLGSYVLYTKARSCNQVTGCSDFGDSMQATARAAEGNDNGGFGLAGSVQLQAGGGSNGNYVELDLVDSSSDVSFEGVTEFELNNVSQSDTPVTWPTSQGYSYELLDNLFIPPSPDGAAVSANFTISMTSSCLRVVGAPSTAQSENEYALLVRF